MPDDWNNMQEPEQNTTAGEPPVDEKATQEPAAPSAPYNGWSSDGSYRYVPPRDTEHAAPMTPSYTTGGEGFNQPPVSPRPPHKKHNGWLIALAIICALAFIILVATWGKSMVELRQSSGTDEPASSTDEVVSSEVPTLEVTDWDENDGGLSYKEIVNRNFDTTVVITVYAQNTNFIFGESSLSEAGSASGIIMREDGYIITNYHCVMDEDTGKKYDRIDVTTYDGTIYKDAKIIGADSSTDLAVIKIDATGLSVAQFGDSASLSVGDRVAALGNAAGLSWTSTFGYVSALARDVYSDTGYAIKCLQVDAAINPGNSGGPLLNNQGLVVGINSAKIAATGYEGLGFSIPINEAKVIIDSLLKNGYVTGRVALGIRGQTISSGMYNGFMVSSIDEGSCLEGTDVQEGDLIVAVNDDTVTDYSTLRAALAKHNVGDEVTVKLLRASRDGRVTSYTVRVKLQEQTATE